MHTGLEHSKSDLEDRLAGRLRRMTSRWHRTVLDYCLAVLAVVVGLTVFGVVLTTSTGEFALFTPSESDTGIQLMPEDPGPPFVPGTGCKPRPDQTADRRMLLLAPVAEAPELLPQVTAMAESLGSYFGTNVEVLGAAQYASATMEGADALVVFANAEFSDLEPVRQAVSDAAALGLPLAWVGLQGAEASDVLGLDFGPAYPTAAGVTNATHNDATIFIADQPRSIRFPAGLSAEETVLGWLTLPDGASAPVTIVNDRRAYVGYSPFDRYNANASLAAVIDAVSHVFGRHADDPRVLFRLEDLNGQIYAGTSPSFDRTADFLLANRFFIHLGIIPEVVNEDQSLPEEQVLTDIGAAVSVVKLVKQHPDEVAIVQHGFRHSRRDERNSHCSGPGCAFEFFTDDDVTMGPDAAAAFARERLAAGRDVLERHLGPVKVFEAPHYTMSPAQSRVAEEMYPVILHSVETHAGTPTGVLLPWFTYRNGAVYGPSSIGYVLENDPGSVDAILQTLEHLERVLPDPIAVVYFHPWLAYRDQGAADLERLVTGIQALGYRSANVCEEAEHD